MPRIGTRTTFDSRCATEGTAQFYTARNRHTCTVVDDPSGRARKVYRWTVTDADDIPTAIGSPRGQMTSGHRFYSGETTWYGFGIYVPADWPTLTHWLIFAEMYGPPYDGGSPARISAIGDDISLWRNDTYGSDRPWRIPLPRETWLDFAIRHTFSTDDAVGSVEIHLNTGAGFVQQTFDDDSQRLMMSTIDAGNSSYNELDIKQYRSGSNAIATLTSYATDVRQGYSIADVDPGSYA